MRPSPSPGRVRWSILALLVGFSLVSYVERINISVAAAHMIPELGLTQVQMGQVFSAFVLGYALLQIPIGTVASYEDIATAIGSPSAVRAVGTAIGRNPVAFLIPCHRVIRTTGALGGYRWGLPRKRAMLAWEAGRTAIAV